jgi:hypothetical protein
MREMSTFDIQGGPATGVTECAIMEEFDRESRNRLIRRLLRQNEIHQQSLLRQRRKMEQAVGEILNVVMGSFEVAGIPLIYLPDSPKMKVILGNVIRVVHVLDI